MCARCDICANAPLEIHLAPWFAAPIGAHGPRDQTLVTHRAPRTITNVNEHVGITKKTRGWTFLRNLAVGITISEIYPNCETNFKRNLFI